MEITPELSNEARAFKPGRYRHFKGDEYEALFVARHSEQRDVEFVVYKSLKNNQIWVRPLKMFVEIIERDGYKGPRFTRLEV